MMEKRGVLKAAAVTVIIAAFFVFATACGGGKDYSLDEAGLAGKLLSEVNFDCELYQVHEEKVANFIDLEGAEKEIMYMGSGSFADSFGIFRLDSSDSAEGALETVNSYLADLQDSFKDYIPKEADKIQQATVLQKGRYVVFCITSDREKASEIISDSFKEVKEEESADGYEDGVREAIAAMLPSIDNLERALDAADKAGVNDGLTDGVRMTLGSLLDGLKRFGFEEVPSLGEQFDPELHNAVMREAGEEPGKILEVFQKGYRVKDKIIRYAMVKVCAE